MFQIRRRIFRFLFVLGFVAAAAAPLSAWKVMTHAYLAFAARADALDDGKVVIYLADHDAGRPLIVGFMKSLDHDNQWCESPRLLFVRDPCVYRKLFLKQIGEIEPGCLTGCDTLPDGSVIAGPIESPLAPGFGGLDMAKGSDGRIFQWGKAFIIATSGGPIAYRPFTSPEVVAALPPAAAVVVHSPEDKAVVLARDGTVWTWGFGAHAQAGMWGTKDQFEALRIPNLESMVQLAAGARHVLALRSNGQVWVWGTNSRGELGLGSKAAPPRPRRVPGLGGVQRVAAGSFFSLAVTTGAFGLGAEKTRTENRLKSSESI